MTTTCVEKSIEKARKLAEPGLHIELGLESAPGFDGRNGRKAWPINKSTGKANLYFIPADATWNPFKQEVPEHSDPDKHAAWVARIRTAQGKGVNEKLGDEKFYKIPEGYVKKAAGVKRGPGRPKGSGKGDRLITTRIRREPALWKKAMKKAGLGFITPKEHWEKAEALNKATIEREKFRRQSQQASNLAAKYLAAAADKSYPWHQRRALERAGRRYQKESAQYLKLMAKVKVSFDEAKDQEKAIVVLIRSGFYDNVFEEEIDKKVKPNIKDLHIDKENKEKKDDTGSSSE